MKKHFLLFIGLILICSAVHAQNGSADDVEAIKKVITEAYQEGINNLGDIKKIDEGFHSDFLMFSKGKNELSTMSIDRWKGYVYKAREKGSYPKEIKTRLEFPMVDVTEDVAVAKIYNFRGDKQIFTDYMMLYKFDEGWKIVAKGYFRLP